MGLHHLTSTWREFALTLHHQRLPFIDNLLQMQETLLPWTMQQPLLLWTMRQPPSPSTPSRTSPTWPPRISPKRSTHVYFLQPAHPWMLYRHRTLLRLNCSVWGQLLIAHGCIISSTASIYSSAHGRKSPLPQASTTAQEAARQHINNLFNK